MQAYCLFKLRSWEKAKAVHVVVTLSWQCYSSSSSVALGEGMWAKSGQKDMGKLSWGHLEDISFPIGA